MTDVNTPCDTCDNETSLLIKRMLILTLFFLLYCLLVFCFACSTPTQRRALVGEVEMTVEEKDNLHRQILDVIFPGDKVR